MVVRDVGRRLVAQPPALGVQPQHEVDVLGDVQRLVEPGADGVAAHQ